MPGHGLSRAFVVAAALFGVTLGAAGCGGQDDRPARWSFISAAIIEPSCATVSCHSAVTQMAAVDLSARGVGYHSLVDRHFVIKGDPSNSPVMFLMEALGSQRMPPDVPLPGADIELIGRWILNGADPD